MSGVLTVVAGTWDVLGITSTVTRPTDTDRHVIGDTQGMMLSMQTCPCLTNHVRIPEGYSCIMPCACPYAHLNLRQPGFYQDLFRGPPRTTSL